MKTITLEAPAKINLTLDILGRRADGYHDLRMVMQSVSLGDTVTVTESGDGFALLAEYDGRIKALLTDIFGAENDFDAVLGGVNLAGVATNGKRVVQNLLEALTPILQQGAQRHLDARADAAVAEADAARAARGGV